MQQATELKLETVKLAIAKYEHILRALEDWQHTYADVFPLLTKEVSEPKGELIEILNMMEVARFALWEKQEAENGRF